MNLTETYKDSNYQSATVLLVILISMLLLNCAFPIHDFANYYYGAKSIFAASFDIYDPWDFNSFIYSFGQENVFANYAPHPPFTRHLFLPLSLMDVQSSKFVFNLFGALIFSYSLFNLFRHLKVTTSFSIIVPLLFFIPLLYNIRYGQSYLLLSALLILLYLSYTKGQFLAASIFLALASVLKFTPLLLFLFFLIKKEWRILVYSSIIIGVFLVFDLLSGGLDKWTVFFGEILPRASNGLINATHSVNHRSVNAFLKGLFIYDADYNPNPFIKTETLYFFFNYFFLFFLLIGAIFISRKRNDFFSFSCWVLLLFLMPSVGSVYSGILLCLPYIGIVSAFSGTKRFLGIATVFLLASPWYNATMSPNLSLWFFISTSILLLAIYQSRNRLLPLTVLFAILLSLPFALKSFPEAHGRAIIEAENTRIVKDIYPSKNALKILVFSANGFETEEMELDNASNLVETEKGIIVNDSVFYFISDARHGYHFNQLRRIDL